MRKGRHFAAVNCPRSDSRAITAQTTTAPRATVATDTIRLRVLARGPVHVVAQYDETALRLDFTWSGEPLPGVHEMRIEPEHGEERMQLTLAAAMIRHQADHLAESRAADGRQRLSVTLDDL